MSKLTDYAVVMLSHMATREGDVYTTARLAERSGVPEPTAAKILKLLARASILASQRGSNGGYELARPAADISVAEIIVALDGPIALAACVEGSLDHCGVEQLCAMRGNWNRVNRAIRDALDDISLVDMAVPFQKPVGTPRKVEAAGVAIRPEQGPLERGQSERGQSERGQSERGLG